MGWGTGKDGSSGGGSGGNDGGQGKHANKDRKDFGKDKTTPDTSSGSSAAKHRKDGDGK
ncbi:hypothetical protein ACFV84_31675 [Kitasatospora sp. NPDC059811]|uniref:hypothetical protein n=1 Tax=Streptomycetaceae TaxID=2062 RepID=UPI000A9600A8|nr:hypothetical protein [Streptomyces sp. MJM8645]